MVLRICTTALTLLVYGCIGSGSGSGGGPSVELDSDVEVGESAPQFGENLKYVPLSRQFDLDLLQPKAPTHFKTLSLSSADDVYIALQTLDYIDRPKRFLLATADELTVDGIPNVQGLKGYKPKLIVEDNSIYVEVQSEGSPLRYKRPKPITYGPNEIVVGGVLEALTAASYADFDGAFAYSKQYAGGVGYNWRGIRWHVGHNNRTEQQSILGGVSYEYMLADSVGVLFGVDTLYGVKQNESVWCGRLQLNVELAFGELNAAIAYGDADVVFGLGAVWNMGPQGKALRSNIAIAKHYVYGEVLLELNY